MMLDKYEQSQLYKSQLYKSVSEISQSTSTNVFQDFEETIKTDINKPPGQKVDNSKYYGLFEQINKEKELVDNVLLKNIDDAKNAYESVKKNLLQIVNSDKNDVIYGEVGKMVDNLDGVIISDKEFEKSGINEHLSNISKDIKNEYFL